MENIRVSRSLISSSTIASGGSSLIPKALKAYPDDFFSSLTSLTELVPMSNPTTLLPCLANSLLNIFIPFFAFRLLTCFLYLNTCGFQRYLPFNDLPKEDNLLYYRPG